MVMDIYVDLLWIIWIYYGFIMDYYGFIYVWITKD